ncbi:ATP adenylyltransferase C-terminal [Penicillium expansum]|nr:ATP adenylyltransferase C-terminal [Penicillium expansum]
MEESLILSKFDNLVQSGLVQYDDKQQIIEHIDGDLKFQFVLTSALIKKPTLTTAPSQPDTDTQTPEKRPGSDINTTGFELGELDSHLVIVNKFCFARPHLMLLTFDGYKRQYEALDEADLRDTWQLLNSTESHYVAFYNCGPDGGCSRLHKHLQVMPLPANSFAAFLDSPGEPETNVPFQWFYRRFEDNVTPAALFEIYKDLLEEATKVSGDDAANAPPGAVCPHNVIFTTRWIIVLPRRRGAINKEAGVNSLGMLGVIAVATKKEIDTWVKLGLTESLAELGVPKVT